MAQKARKKKITVSEFKSWLQGIEEMQPENWTPNAKQWQLIKDKIELLIDKQNKKITLEDLSEELKELIISNRQNQPGSPVYSNPINIPYEVSSTGNVPNVVQNNAPEVNNVQEAMVQQPALSQLQTLTGDRNDEGYESEFI